MGTTKLNFEFYCCDVKLLADELLLYGRGDEGGGGINVVLLEIAF